MKYALLLALVFGLFFAFGCVQNMPAQQDNGAQAQQPQEKPPVPVPCASAIGVEAKDNCFMGIAKSTMNASMCARIYSAQLVDECLNATMQNIACSGFLLSSGRDACYYEAAKAANSTAQCALISSLQMRQQCISELSPPCELETNAAAKGRCLAYLKNDFSYCTNDECRYSFALEKSAYPACLELAEGAQKYACFAIVLEDSGKCDQAPQLPTKDLCTQMVALHTDNIQTCNRATLGSEYRNGCYALFAIKESNYTLCSLASPETARDACYADFAKSTGIFGACANVVNSLNKEACYLFAARENSNPLACEGMLYERSQTDCYANVIFAGKRIPLEYCEEIRIGTWKDKCFETMAPFYADRAICEKISGSDSKASCVASFEE
ncbi:hypothetical protein J4441_00605 [Candidatus Micrarchaeota archaeon]|nr:hypothetical protein [Candidatus Micrarchaeota archaeon]